MNIYIPHPFNAEFGHIVSVLLFCLSTLIFAKTFEQKKIESSYVAYLCH